MWDMGIRDKSLISIIGRILKSDIKGIGIPEKGTPQGGIMPITVYGRQQIMACNKNRTNAETLMFTGFFLVVPLWHIPIFKCEKTTVASFKIYLYM